MRLEAHPLCAHRFSDGRVLLDVLDHFGVLGGLDILAIKKIYQTKAVRAIQLAEHADMAPARNWHLVANADADTRPVCVTCGRNGTAGFQKLWLCAKCPGVVKQSQAHEVARTLRIHSEEAVTVSKLLAQMARAV